MPETNGGRQRLVFLERFRDEQLNENRRTGDKVSTLSEAQAVTARNVEEIRDDVRAIKGLIRWAIGTFLAGGVLIVSVVSLVVTG